MYKKRDHIEILSNSVAVIKPKMNPILSILVVTLLAFEGVKSQTRRGDLTYYYEWRGNYGSCALDRSRWDQFYVAALARSHMALPAGMTNPNNHPLCAAQYCIRVHGARGSVVLKVSDTCWGCVNDDVDVADTVFPMLDDPVKGRVKVTWNFVDCRKTPPGKY